ncbi:MAG: exosortase O [Thermosynechococcaceae cyanobacterium]
MTYDRNSVYFDAKPTPLMPLNRLWGGITVLLWCFLFLPDLTGFTHLLQGLSQFNLMLLAGAAVVLLMQGIRYRDQWNLSLEPTFQGWPVVLMLGAAIASLLTRTLLDVEHLAVVGVVIGAYGLFGLFCDPQAWKRSIPFMGAFALLMFLFALEFTDLGHLARTAIAEVTEYLLQPFHVNAISSEDILVLSTGIAFVDLPCSGFKNIEIGSLFFIAASVLERKQLGLRWFLVGLTTIALLITANVARILVIVVLTFVIKQPTLAGILHVPLGLCGFITVCLIALLLLRWVPRQTVRSQITHPDSSAVPTASIRNALLTLGLMIGLVCVPPPAAAAPVTFNIPQWSLPLKSRDINLSPPEQTFFIRNPGVVAEKQAFEFNDISGSMIFVASPSWQAHHAPELCLTGSGFKIDQMQKRLLTPQVTGRWLSLDQGQHQAAYWFQSSQRTTDNYLDRVWSEITRREPQWTMVSILFDQPVSADNPEVRSILEEVHDAVDTAMT